METIPAQGVEELQVRLASPSDVPTIVDYNVALALESESKQLDPETVQRGVTRGLQQRDEVRYFLAVESGGQVAGQIMLTREWSDWRDGWIMWIQSVYVLPAWRGKGVFRKLLDTAIGELRADPDVVGMRLYVEVDNRRAQEVYLRTGFGDASYRVLEMMFGSRSGGP